MQKITTHLWFDKEAKEAAELYTSAFNEAFGNKKSKIKNVTVLHNTPSGTCDIVTAELAGQEFTLLSAGPLFKFNPSISFLIACKTKEQVDSLWNKFSAGGKALMELGKYPFSEKYGWIQDKYGLSWQVMLMGNIKFKQTITPTLMFVKDMAGRAEEAMNFYVDIFSAKGGSALGGKKSKIGNIMRYGKGESPEKEGTIKHAGFKLEGTYFAAMDSAQKHEFNFNEAISFMVHSKNQKEIDYYWYKLSAHPESEQCGWLKDKYGVSWQIVPTEIDKMFKGKDQKKIDRVTEAFLKMKKLDLKILKKAAQKK